MTYFSFENYSLKKLCLYIVDKRMINIIKIKIQNLKIPEELEPSFEKYYYEHSNTFFSRSEKILKRLSLIKNTTLNSEQIMGLDQ